MHHTLCQRYWHAGYCDAEGACGQRSLDFRRAFAGFVFAVGIVAIGVVFVFSAKGIRVFAAGDGFFTELLLEFLFFLLLLALELFSALLAVVIWFQCDLLVGGIVLL